MFPFREDPVVILQVKHFNLGRPGKVECKSSTRVVLTAASATPSLGFSAIGKGTLGNIEGHKGSPFTGLFPKLLFCTFLFSLQKYLWCFKSVGTTPWEWQDVSTVRVWTRLFVSRDFSWCFISASFGRGPKN